MKWYTIRCSEPIKLAIVALAQAADRSERYILEQLAEAGLPALRRRLVGNGSGAELGHAPAGESPADSEPPGGDAATSSPGKTGRARDGR